MALSRLRESAKLAPRCFGCGLQNPNGDLLALAHSNELRHGRGAYHKTPDIFGAILCLKCHDRCDGRAGGLSREEKREMHRAAHDLTLLWWWEAGYLGVP